MLDALDYAEINNLLNLYPHVIDVPENYGRAVEIFDEDSVFDATAVGLGCHEGVAAMIEYWAHSPRRAVELEVTRLLSHNAVNIHVFEDADADGDGTARAWSRCLGVSVDGVAACMAYHDTLKRTPAGWRIATRKLVLLEPPRVTPRETVAGAGPA